MPNGLVIGADTGQMNPLAGAAPEPADEPRPLDADEEPDWEGASASRARSFAAIASLAAAIACDSRISSCTCRRVTTRVSDFALRAFASLLLLETSSPRRIAACCARA